MKRLFVFLISITLFSTFACTSEQSSQSTEETLESTADKEETGQATEVKEEITKSGLQIGDTAPDFKLKNVDGKMYSLAELRLEDGSEPKGYIVTFTCNTCPYAKAYEDRLIELHNDMSKEGYPVVAVNPNDPVSAPGDSFEKMKERATEKEFPFLYLFDEEQEVYPVYGATRTPEIYLLDKDLTLVYTGAIDDNYQDAEAVSAPYVRSAVEAVLAGETPEPAMTKAIGCTIKAKKKS